MIKITKREILFVPILLFVLGASILIVTGVGSSSIPIKTIYNVFENQLFNGNEGVSGDFFTVAQYQIIWNIRLPRVIFGVLCGAGLSICGAVMQGIVLNPIADPYILGISSGASAGAAWAMLMPLPISFFKGEYQVLLTAMLFAMLACVIVYTMAQFGGRGQIQPVTLLLSGIAVNAVMGAITSLLIFLARSDEGIAAVYNWQMGSLASAQWSSLMFPLVGVTIGLIVFSASGNKLNILMLGEEDAIALGINVNRFRSLMFFISSVVVASLISVTGIIGFVGLMVPHIVRLLIKSSNNITVIPLSAIFGAIYLIWADAFARGAFGYAELPLGIITAFIGAPFFFYLMLKKSYGGRSDEH